MNEAARLSLLYEQKVRNSRLTARESVHLSCPPVRLRVFCTTALCATKMANTVFRINIKTLQNGDEDYENKQHDLI